MQKGNFGIFANLYSPNPLTTKTIETSTLTW